jgi:GT2 family glycosyltransferase
VRVSEAPKVTAIVVSYERRDDLRLALDALRASEWPREALEIVVVDNASKDGAADVAASIPGVIVIRNAENRGFAEANDQGLAIATGAYVALVNNDAVVDPRWIAESVALLEAHPRAAATGGKQFFWNDDQPLGERGNHYYAYTTMDPTTGHGRAHVDASDALREVATLSGSCVLIRRAAIDDVTRGGRDPFLEPEFFTYYEETDFFARALRRGWTLLYRGEPGVWHRVRGGEAGPSYRYLFHMYRNRVLFAARCFDEDAWRGVLGELRREATKALTHAPLRLVRPRDPDARARRDTLVWVLEHRALLEAHRARLRDLGGSYPLAGRAIQDRAPLVSIVIANHDYGRFLGEAIESALGQTHGEIEVIVVDDGSRDDSVEVASRYPVRLIRQENLGVARARNRGAQEAQGELLVFLDADDVLDRTFVERCWASLREQPADVAYAYTQMELFGLESRIFPSHVFGSRTLVAEGNFVPVTTLLRRAAFESAGGFDPTWAAKEDYELWLRLLARGLKGVLVPAPLLRYRRHGQTRDALSTDAARAIEWQLRATYSRLFWRACLRHPYLAARGWAARTRARRRSP